MATRLCRRVFGFLALNVCANSKLSLFQQILLLHWRQQAVAGPGKVPSPLVAPCDRLFKGNQLGDWFATPKQTSRYTQNEEYLKINSPLPVSGKPHFSYLCNSTESPFDLDGNKKSQGSIFVWCVLSQDSCLILKVKKVSSLPVQYC